MYKGISRYEKFPKINDSVEGERIETKVFRIVRDKEPIKDGAPMIYEERGSGVNPAHNIRTDRWEIALQAMDAVSRASIAMREGVAVAPDAEGGESAASAESTSPSD